MNTPTRIISRITPPPHLLALEKPVPFRPRSPARDLDPGFGCTVRAEPSTALMRCIADTKKPPLSSRTVSAAPPTREDAPSGLFSGLRATGHGLPTATRSLATWPGLLHTLQPEACSLWIGPGRGARLAMAGMIWVDHSDRNESAQDKEDGVRACSFAG